ncbi:MAG: hypothetical protein IJ071_06075 [Ruminococcus sp.]|nr:hypothetical protein [Ruminococcus sp.]
MINTAKHDLIPDNKLTGLARWVIGVLMIFIMAVLTAASLLHTTGMEIVGEGMGYDTSVNRLRQGLEVVIYYNDNIFSNIFWLAFGLIACWIVMPLMKKIPLWAELVFIGLWTAVLSYIWIHSSMCAPSEDSGMVTSASWAFAHDDFSALTGDERYFKNYSFQLGYVLFNEIIIRIAEVFGPLEDLLVLEVMNGVFLALAYVGIVLINDTVFADKRIRHITVFLLTFSAAPVIFTTFIYGIIPGFCFAVWAIYFEILFLRSEKLPKMILFGLLSAFCITIAVMIKSNNLIGLVAVCGVAFVGLFKEKRLIPNIAYIVCAVVMAVSISPIVKSSYESRSGADLGEAVPFVSWFALGMNEPSFIETAPGWYNYGSTVSNFEVHGFDPDAAGEASKENIKERLKYFSENTQYRNDFFYNKFVSQWNETSYQSIWNNKVRYHYEEMHALANWACNDHEQGVKRYMDIIAQLVFFAVLFGLIFALRDKNFLALVFPLVILGGVLYHMLAEAKSQYAMPYYILMIGFAGYGLCGIRVHLPEKLDAFLGRFRFLCEKGPILEGAAAAAEEPASVKAPVKAEEPAAEKAEAEQEEELPEEPAEEEPVKEAPAKEEKPAPKQQKPKQGSGKKKSGKKK